MGKNHLQDYLNNLKIIIKTVFLISKILSSNSIRKLIHGFQLQRHKELRT